MNKESVILIAMLALTMSSKQVISEEPDTAEIVTKCLHDTNATSKDADDFFLSIDPPFATESQKCLAGCLYEEFGLLVNGSVSESGFNDYIATHLGEKVHPKIAGCPAEVGDLGDDRCVTGPALHKCIAKGLE